MKRYEVKLSFSVVSEGPAAVLNRPELVAEYMQGAFDERPEQESFWVIFLNRKNYAKGRFMATLGTQTNSLVSASEVFRSAILGGACAIICVHNHPSGDPAPSMSDVAVTRQIKDAGKILGIEVLDHVIIGDAASDPTGTGYYSFRGAGQL